MEAAGEVTELAPVRFYQRGLGALFAIFIVIGVVSMLLVLASYGHPSWPSANFTLSSIGMGVLGWAYLWLWVANTRLLIGPAVVGYQDLLGRRRFWPTSDIARVVQITIA